MLDREKCQNDNFNFFFLFNLQEQSEQAEATLKLKVKGEKGYFEIPVCKADKRFFPFQFRGDQRGDTHGMVSEISVVNGTKYISLKTIIDIKNHYIKPVNIYAKSEIKNTYKKLGCIEPDQTFNVPVDVVYSESCEFCFQIQGPEEDKEALSYESYNWRQLMDTPVYSKKIHCTNSMGRPEKFINIEGIEIVSTFFQKKS